MRLPRIKFKLACTLLVSVVVLCGCAHDYLMKLSNGDQLVAASKPKVRGANYHFRDDAGMEHVIPRSRVVKITPGSMLNEQQPPPSPENSSRPKRKHWYFLWLA